MDETLPPFGVTSAKPFPLKIGLLKTFQNCGDLDLPHVSICIYRSYSL